MDGTFLVLRPDLVVYVPAAAISFDDAVRLHDEWEQATSGRVRLVVIASPARVVDVRDADPELEALAERIAARIPQAVA